jgi:UDP-4-amino-4,6-dideoxy-N-acetyl-beta-L-altrosamine transaminase
VIPYGRQAITQDDIDAVEVVLRSDWLTQGSAVPAFEDVIKKTVGADYAVAVNSATSALHLACLAVGLGPGDWLWTVPNTFVASANCARYCGALVDFVDIDRSGNMSVPALRKKLNFAREAGSLPKVVIPVAYSGAPCDLAEIRTLADEFGFFIIEDASHAIGASYLGKPVGCGVWADISVFSFHPVKIITTGEGGCAVTNNKEFGSRMRLLRSHGISRDDTLFEGGSHGPWFYEMVDLGWNYRMTDIQAALGVSQMSRLKKIIDRRRELALRYDQLLAGIGLELPKVAADRQSAWHLYVIGWNEKVFGTTRLQAFNNLRTSGIGVNVHYIPVHMHPYYQRLGFKAGDFPVSEKHYLNAITLPLFFGLTNSQQDEVVSAVRRLAIKK